MHKINTARNNYLQAEVSTATPQKLQLLLVEAAIKNVHRTKQAWKDSRFDVGVESLTVAQDIISEILCSLDMEGNPTIAKQLASIYLFIFRRLAEGGMWRDESKLDDALRVLNSERETWQQVCEKFGSTTTQNNNNNNIVNGNSKNNSVNNNNSGNNNSGNSSSGGGNVSSNGNVGGSTSSGGYSKPQSFQANSSTISRSSGAYGGGGGIQTISFAAKPIQSNYNNSDLDSGLNSSVKKSALSGIQTNSSLASSEKKLTQNQQSSKPNSTQVRPNPYK
ncbi:MAG: flagellar export chaperone FliS [Planctomycetaceae bacterium]|jgi:flagellar protein FliS|nr:flagellar export chaperone FliS [Planctomycetaceae bacterium]